MNQFRLGYVWFSDRVGEICCIDKPYIYAYKNGDIHWGEDTTVFSNHIIKDEYDVVEEKVYSLVPVKSEKDLTKQSLEGQMGKIQEQLEDIKKQIQAL